MGDGLAAAWVMEHLAHVAATSQRVFSNAQFVGVASDGKRLGSPAEETNVYMIWHGDKNYATWSKPMVIRATCRTGICGRCIPHGGECTERNAPNIAIAS